MLVPELPKFSVKAKAVPLTVGRTVKALDITVAGETQVALLVISQVTTS